MSRSTFLRRMEAIRELTGLDMDDYDDMPCFRITLRMIKSRQEEMSHNDY
jgi:DNA-binding PucR family transcriptional regulator